MYFLSPGDFQVGDHNLAMAGGEGKENWIPPLS